MKPEYKQLLADLNMTKTGVARFFGVSRQSVDAALNRAKPNVLVKAMYLLREVCNRVLLSPVPTKQNKGSWPEMPQDNQSTAARLRAAGLTMIEDSVRRQENGGE